MSRRNQKKSWEEIEEMMPELEVSKDIASISEHTISSKVKLKEWKKDLKACRITKEEFDQLRGANQKAITLTEDQKMKILVQESKQSAVQEYTQKKEVLILMRVILELKELHFHTKVHLYWSILI